MSIATSATTDYVKLTKPFTFAYKMLTEMWWVKLSSVAPANPAAMSYHNNTGVDSAWFQVACDTTGNLIVNTDTGQANGSVLKANQWYHVAMTRYNGTTYEVYLNGNIDIATDIGGGADATINTQYLCGFNGGAFGISGQIGAFKTWGRVLSKSEINYEMLCQQPVSFNQLYGFYPLQNIDLLSPEFGWFPPFTAVGMATGDDNPQVGFATRLVRTSQRIMTLAPPTPITRQTASNRQAASNRGTSTNRQPASGRLNVGSLS